MGRAEAARGMGARRGMAAAIGPHDAEVKSMRTRCDTGGASDRMEQLSWAYVAGGKEQHGQKRRGEMWCAASRRTDVRVGALS